MSLINILLLAKSEKEIEIAARLYLLFDKTNGIENLRFGFFPGGRFTEDAPLLAKRWRKVVSRILFKE